MLTKGTQVKWTKSAWTKSSKAEGYIVKVANVGPHAYIVHCTKGDDRGKTIMVASSVLEVKSS